MADAELQTELVLDESALENVEQKQLEVTGEADSVQEAKELNEEQNEKLGFISRSIFSIVKKLSVIGAVILAFLPVLQKIGDALNISFQDVRTAIVEAINVLKTAFVDTFASPILEALGLAGEDGETDPVETPQTTGEVAAFAAGESTLPGIGGRFSLNVLEAFDQISGGESGENNQGQGLDVNLFTSRDQLTGDSTQQDQESSILNFSFNGGGSGGNQVK